MAYLFFGKLIQQEIAKKIYFEFEKARIVTPEKILEADWDKLVEILNKGHYVRYDFSMATKLLDIYQELKQKTQRFNYLDRKIQKQKRPERYLLDLRV